MFKNKLLFTIPFNTIARRGRFFTIPPTGIYIIYSDVVASVYIGMSRNLADRFSQHKSVLVNKTKSNAMYNPQLKKDFDTHGPGHFFFGVLEFCPIEELCDKEFSYIESFKVMQYPIYNTQPGGVLKPPSWEGKKHSVETKKTMSRNNAHNKSWTGRKHTEEEKEKISKANLHRKLSEEHKAHIKATKMNTENWDEIARKYRLTQLQRRRAVGGYLGVSQRGKKWIAYITHNSKQTYLGNYGTAEEAAVAHDTKARELHGSMAVVNFSEVPNA